MCVCGGKIVFENADFLVVLFQKFFVLKNYDFLARKTKRKTGAVSRPRITFVVTLWKIFRKSLQAF